MYGATRASMMALMSSSYCRRGGDEYRVPVRLCFWEVAIPRDVTKAKYTARYIPDGFQKLLGRFTGPPRKTATIFSPGSLFFRGVCRETSAPTIVEVTITLPTAIHEGLYDCTGGRDRPPSHNVGLNNLL